MEAVVDIYCPRCRKKTEFIRFHSCYGQDNYVCRDCGYHVVASELEGQICPFCGGGIIDANGHNESREIWVWNADTRLKKEIYTPKRCKCTECGKEWVANPRPDKLANGIDDKLTIQIIGACLSNKQADVIRKLHEKGLDINKSTLSDIVKRWIKNNMPDPLASSEETISCGSEIAVMQIRLSYMTLHVLLTFTENENKADQAYLIGVYGDSSEELTKLESVLERINKSPSKCTLTEVTEYFIGISPVILHYLNNIAPFAGSIFFDFSDLPGYLRQKILNGLDGYKTRHGYDTLKEKLLLMHRCYFANDGLSRKKAFSKFMSSVSDDEEAIFNKEVIEKLFSGLNIITKEQNLEESYRSLFDYSEKEFLDLRNKYLNKDSETKSNLNVMDKATKAEIYSNHEHVDALCTIRDDLTTFLEPAEKADWGVSEMRCRLLRYAVMQRQSITAANGKIMSSYMGYSMASIKDSVKRFNDEAAFFLSRLSY